MQEMDILDMNVLDETENDNGFSAENDEEMENFHGDEEELLNEEPGDGLLELEAEAKYLEVMDGALKPLCSFKSARYWSGYCVVTDGRVRGVRKRWILFILISQCGKIHH